jgi:hypothetical protein
MIRLHGVPTFPRDPTVAHPNVRPVRAVVTTFGGCDASSQPNVSGRPARCGERPAARHVFPR